MENELVLVINNPSEGEFLKEIVWNRQEFVELIKSKTEQYRGLVYTDDQIADAKKDRAELNKMKKGISDERIQVKKKIMEPYSKFEAEVSDVVKMIDEPIAMIDAQIKEYEDRKKEEKKEALRSYYNEIASDLGEMLPFDRVFDQRYLNATVSLNKAKGDILEKVEKFKKELESLEKLCDGKYLIAAKEVYIKTLKVADAMSEAMRLMDLDKRAEEERLRKEKEAEAEKQRLQEASDQKQEEHEAESDMHTEPQTGIGKAIASIERSAFEQSVPTQDSIDVPDTSAGAKEDDTKLCKASFTVYGTRAQIMQLRDYMNEHNIKFGKVEK